MRNAFRAKRRNEIDNEILCNWIVSISCALLSTRNRLHRWIFLCLRFARHSCECSTFSELWLRRIHPFFLNCTFYILTAFIVIALKRMFSKLPLFSDFGHTKRYKTNKTHIKRSTTFDNAKDKQLIFLSPSAPALLHPLFTRLITIWRRYAMHFLYWFILFAVAAAEWACLLVPLSIAGTQYRLPY